MFFRVILYLIISVLTVLALDKLLGNFSVDSTTATLLFVLALTLIDSIIVPIAKIIALPINIITLGLFNIVINLAVIWASVNLIDGVDVSGTTSDKIIAYAIIAIVMSVVSGISDSLSEDRT